MSNAEFHSWIAYASRHGSLNAAVRAEDGFALVAAMLSRLRGGTLQPRDFKPKREAEREVGIGDVFSMLKAKARESRRGNAKSRHTNA